MTLYDRYLLRRFLQVFVILYVSTFGLYLVIDAFTNVDAFQDEGGGSVGVLLQMARYYALQSTLFFELVGQMLGVIAVVVVFALLARHGEVHPILAAGVPTYRLVVPLCLGVLLVNLGLVANQELILPRIAHLLQQGRLMQGQARHVEPVYDQSLILISGDELFLDTGRMREAEMVLPAGTVAEELTAVIAREAVYYPRTNKHPAGWHLKGMTPPFAELKLTPDGRKLVRQLSGTKEAFLVTNVGPDQLYNRSRNFAYVSTPELIRRIRHPTSGPAARSQSLHLHSRLTDPLVSLVAVLLAVPLIIRREGSGLVTNMAVCTGVLGLLLAAGQLFHFLGSAGFLPADLASWATVISGGTLAAWLSGSVQT